MNALREYTEWLPTELVCMATKPDNGYDARTESARKGTIYDHLRQEWRQGQLLRSQGMLQAPEHRKAAQLQLARFSASLFDKIGTVDWLYRGLPATKTAFEECAVRAAETVLETEPWISSDPFEFNPVPKLELRKTFEETIFSSGLLELQKNIVLFADKPGDTPMEKMIGIDNVVTPALLLGGTATLCYLEFAEHNLSTDQYKIPQSLQHTS